VWKRILGHVLEPVHPTALKVTQPRFLAFAADAVVKEARLTDGQLDRRRVGADLLELADVSCLLGFRPLTVRSFNLVAVHVKHARAFGSV
jgi:hypothetical protein